MLAFAKQNSSIRYFCDRNPSLPALSVASVGVEVDVGVGGGMNPTSSPRTAAAFDADGPALDTLFQMPLTDQSWTFAKAVRIGVAAPKAARRRRGGTSIVGAAVAAAGGLARRVGAMASRQWRRLRGNKTSEPAAPTVHVSPGASPRVHDNGDERHTGGTTEEPLLPGHGTRGGVDWEVGGAVGDNGHGDLSLIHI